MISRVASEASIAANAAAVPLSAILGAALMTGLQGEGSVGAAAEVRALQLRASALDKANHAAAAAVTVSAILGAALMTGLRGEGSAGARRRCVLCSCALAHPMLPHLRGAFQLLGVLVQTLLSVGECTEKDTLSGPGPRGY